MLEAFPKKKKNPSQRKNMVGLYFKNKSCRYLEEARCLCPYLICSSDPSPPSQVKENKIYDMSQQNVYDYFRNFRPSKSRVSAYALFCFHAFIVKCMLATVVVFVLRLLIICEIKLNASLLAN